MMLSMIAATAAAAAVAAAVAAGNDTNTDYYSWRSARSSYRQSTLSELTGS